MTVSNTYFSTNIPSRDICNPIIGYPLLSAIQGKIFRFLQDDEQGQLIDVERKWQLYSSAENILQTENLARQCFFELAQQQLQLQNHLSQQRCLILIEEPKKWRVWQLIQIESSWADLLSNAIIKGSAKEVAALLFVSSEKFLLAKHYFSDIGFQPILTLETLSFQDKKPTFLGFLPINAVMEDDLALAFKTIITQILTNPKLNVHEVLQHLKQHFSIHQEHQALLNKLQTMLTR